MRLAPTRARESFSSTHQTPLKDRFCCVPGRAGEMPGLPLSSGVTCEQVIVHVLSSGQELGSSQQVVGIIHASSHPFRSQSIY